MFKTRCPKCNNDTEVINGICKKCGYNIADYMKENGLIDGNKLITDKVFICPNCGTIDAGENSIRLKCYKCGTSYKPIKLTRKEYWEGLYIGEKGRQLIEEYVGDTINWDIYNAREDEWNKIQEERKKYQQQKQVEEQARQDAINHPRCPKCGSTAITAGQRGYSLLTGFLGSNKTVCRCANCGYSWKPKK